MTNTHQPDPVRRLHTGQINPSIVAIYCMGRNPSTCTSWLGVSCIRRNTLVLSCLRCFLRPLQVNRRPLTAHSSPLNNMESWDTEHGQVHWCILHTAVYPTLGCVSYTLCTTVPALAVTSTMYADTAEHLL